VSKLGKHTTLDKDLKKQVNWVINLPEVTKVVIGLSNACRHKYPPGFIRCLQIVEAGIKANGYSGKGVTNLFIRVNSATNIAKVKSAIENRFKV